MLSLKNPKKDRLLKCVCANRTPTTPTNDSQRHLQTKKGAQRHLRNRFHGVMGIDYIVHRVMGIDYME
jgi:hypothetical protein